MVLLKSSLRRPLVLAPMARSARPNVASCPCAAKLLHDTMFGNNDPGSRESLWNSSNKSVDSLV